jgi:hypothetical protein
LNIGKIRVIMKICQIFILFHRAFATLFSGLKSIKENNTRDRCQRHQLKKCKVLSEKRINISVENFQNNLKYVLFSLQH